MPRSKMKIIEVVLGNLVYAIWHARNEAVWHIRVTTVKKMVETNKKDSKLRFIHLLWNRPTYTWVRDL